MTKPLSQLELDDFDSVAVWATDLEHDDYESVVAMHGKTQISDCDSDVWVRFHGALADGTAVRGIAMILTPPPKLHLWSFFIDGQWVPLHLPPAPSFVLERTGPARFAQRLSKSLADVFPIRIHTHVTDAATGRHISDEISVDSIEGA
jgi:hypothetical protein